MNAVLNINTTSSPLLAEPTVLPSEVPSYSSSAMLVQLSISQWTARKLDKKVSAEVADAKRAAKGAGNYNKKLLGD